MKGIYKKYKCRRHTGRLSTNYCYAYLKKDQNTPSNLLLYSTIQCSTIVIVILCVCVCFLPIHSGHQVRWTYTSRGHTGFLIHLLSAVRALIFLARRIQPFLSLVDCEVEFCVLTI